jgi:pSer/pThr/pTyr-binding forkhead associated (FHA) protein
MDIQNNTQIDDLNSNQEEALPTAPDITTSIPKYELIVRNEFQNTETSYLLEEGKEVSVGADLDCSIPVDDDYMSSNHFLINVGQNGIEVSDNNSRNGLFLKLKETTLIEPGQPLKAGRTTFRVQERLDG